MVQGISGTGPGPRDRMVRSAAALISRRGLPGTGMREVAEHAGAPRGSIGHHFPAGKDQLTVDALHWMGALVAGQLEQAGAGGDPLAVLHRFVSLWRTVLDDSDVTAGCSIAAVVNDSDDPALLTVTDEVFRAWRRPFTGTLLAAGVAPSRAAGLATTVLAGLEGAVVLCRAERGTVPLDQTAAELEVLLTSALAAGAPPG